MNILNSFCGGKKTELEFSCYSFWSTFLWICVHLTFVTISNILFRIFKIKRFVKDYVISEIWQILFYAFCSIIILSKFNFDVSTLLNIPYFDTVTFYTKSWILFYVIIFSFYVESIIWEITRHVDLNQFCNFLLILIFLLSAWQIRFVKFPILFLLTISLRDILTGWLRVSLSFSNNKSESIQTSYKIIFVLYLISIVIFYIYIMPFYFVLPIQYIKYSNDNIWTELMIISFIIWIILDIFNSPLSNLLKHLFYENSKCEQNIFKCILKLPKNELKTRLLSYYMSNMKNEKYRDTVNPNHQSSKQSVVQLYQTIRCINILKKKIKTRRQQKIDETKLNTP